MNCQKQDNVQFKNDIMVPIMNKEEIKNQIL